MGLLDFLEPLDYPRQAVYNLGAAGKHLLSGDSTWDDLLRAAPALLGGGLTAGLMASGVGAPLGILAGSVLGGLGQGAENAVDRDRFGAPQVSELTKALGVDPESWPGMATTFGIGALTDPLSYASGLGLGRNLAERGAASEANALRASLIAKGAMPPEVAALTKAVDEAGNPLKLFHGTGAAFDQYDMARMSPHSLYGPGIYTTTNPEITEGYAMGKAANLAEARSQAESNLASMQANLQHALSSRSGPENLLPQYQKAPFAYLPEDLATELRSHKVSDTLLQSLAHGYHDPGFGPASDYYQNYRQALDRFGLPLETQSRVEDWVKAMPETAQRVAQQEFESRQQGFRDVFGKQIQEAEQTLANTPEPRANVRAHFLDVRNPFDARETGEDLPRGTYLRIFGKLPPEGLPVPEGYIPSTEELKARPHLAITPQNVYDTLTQTPIESRIAPWDELGGKAYANEMLKRAGYDAITHEGGGRAGGGRIMHDVWIALHPEQAYKPYVAPAVRPVPRMSPLLSALLAQQGGARAYDLR